jgi:hypothetical protein
MLKVVRDGADGQVGELHLGLDDLAREGARRMLQTALAAEVAEYIDRHRSERDEQGRALVVRNGTARPRQVTVGSGTLEVESPLVNDRRMDADGNAAEKEIEAFREERREVSEGSRLAHTGTRTACSHSSTSRQSTGFTSGRATPFSRRAPPCDYGSASPKGQLAATRPDDGLYAAGDGAGSVAQTERRSLAAPRACWRGVP